MIFVFSPILLLLTTLNIRHDFQTPHHLSAFLNFFWLKLSGLNLLPITDMSGPAPSPPEIQIYAENFQIFFLYTWAYLCFTS